MLTIWKRGSALVYRISFFVIFIYSVDKYLIHLASVQMRNYHTRVRGIGGIVEIRSYVIMLQAECARLRRLPFNGQRKIAGYYVKRLRCRQFCKLSMCQTNLPKIETYCLGIDGK